MDFKIRMANLEDCAKLKIKIDYYDDCANGFFSPKIITTSSYLRIDNRVVTDQGGLTLHLMTDLVCLCLPNSA